MPHDEPIDIPEPVRAPQLRQQAVTGMLTPQPPRNPAHTPSSRSETPVTAYVLTRRLRHGQLPETVFCDSLCFSAVVARFLTALVALSTAFLAAATSTLV